MFKCLGFVCVCVWWFCCYCCLVVFIYLFIYLLNQALETGVVNSRVNEVTFLRADKILSLDTFYTALLKVVEFIHKDIAQSALPRGFSSYT